MNTELVAVQNQLEPLKEQFAEVLPAHIAPERLVRTVLISCERNPRLMAQNLRSSLLQAAMTSAVLGLEVDGVTGQGFIIPFGGKNPAAQFIPGYKGYNTIAGRAGYTINGNVVREGDDFDYQEGSDGFINHKRTLGKEANRKIMAAWATATKPGSSPIVSLLSIDELMSIKGKSMGAKKASSPWNDQSIGFPAMCEKSAKLRLKRNLPLNLYQLGAEMEGQQEIGNTCHINKAAELVINGESTRIVPEPKNISATKLINPNKFTMIWVNRSSRDYDNITQWQAAMKTGIDNLASKKDDLKKFKDLNQPVIDFLENENPDAWIWIVDLFDYSIST